MSTPRTLLVLRHAKSDWGAGADSDFDRPLNPRGRRAADRMGDWLRDTGLLPERVVSSPALRARETIERVCRAARLDIDIVRFEPRLYLASLDTLRTLINRTEAPVTTLMLVGHNPGLEDLVAFLSAPDGRLERAKPMPTAALAVFDFDRAWADVDAARGRLRDLVRPRQLPS